MSEFQKVAAAIAVLVVVAGCSQSIKSNEVSKTAIDQVGFAPNAAPTDEYLKQQADALDQLTKDLVRQSTVKGAAIGAATGCAVATIAAAGMNRCLGSAAAGAVVGGAVGRANGKAEVNRRVQFVSHNKVGRGLQKAEADLANLQWTLDEVIEAQSLELLVLAEGRKDGSISATEYANRVEDIRKTRAELAEVLSLTSEQAKQVHASLLEAQAKGQEKLEWHVLASQRLTENSISAREAVSLF